MAEEAVLNIDTKEATLNANVHTVSDPLSPLADSGSEPEPPLEELSGAEKQRRKVMVEAELQAKEAMEEEARINAKKSKRKKRGKSKGVGSAGSVFGNDSDDVFNF